MNNWKKTPYQRIVEAARLRRGIRLSLDDVACMADDDAIRLLAENDDEAQRDTEVACKVLAKMKKTDQGD